MYKEKFKMLKFLFLSKIYLEFEFWLLSIEYFFKDLVFNQEHFTLDNKATKIKRKISPISKSVKTLN